jgi:hypothetical protein
MYNDQIYKNFMKRIYLFLVLFFAVFLYLVVIFNYDFFNLKADILDDKTCAKNDNYGLLEGECEVLEDLWNTTKGDYWVNKDGWFQDDYVANWNGISVISLNGDHHILEIKLSSNNLEGEIPESLGNLEKLRILNLSKNKLQGSIPNSLGQLSNLEVINLFNNELTGEIPKSFGGLLKLKDLILGSNLLSGTLPLELFNLVNLQYFHIYTNSIEGNIPNEIENLVNLQYLYLSDNNLTGEIPNGLWKIEKLKNLYLSGNNLVGKISEEIGNLVNIEKLNLSYNRFLGSIPNEINNLVNLKEFNINNNIFLCESNKNFIIPDNLSNFFETIETTTYNSQQSGCEDSDLLYEYYLLVKNSQLEESKKQVFINTVLLEPFKSELLYIAKSLNQTKWQYIGLESKSIQNGLGFWFKFNDVDDNNNLLNIGLHGISTDDNSGIYFIIQDVISKCDNGESDECIKGNKESVLDYLSGFKEGKVYCSKNDNYGLTQEECKSLQFLFNYTDGENWINNTNWGEVVDINTWHGITVNNIENKNYITKINLSDNNLSGKLPKELGGLVKLEELDLSNNNLTGEIPSELSTLISLKKINLSKNYLNGEISIAIASWTVLEDLILFDNLFSGSIPPFLKNLIKLKNFIINENNLVGEIPEDLEILENIETLNVLKNYLQCNSDNTINNLPKIVTWVSSKVTNSEVNPQWLGCLYSNTAKSFYYLYKDASFPLEKIESYTKMLLTEPLSSEMKLLLDKVTLSKFEYNSITEGKNGPWFRFKDLDNPGYLLSIGIDERSIDSEKGNYLITTGPLSCENDDKCGSGDINRVISILNEVGSATKIGSTDCNKENDINILGIPKEECISLANLYRDTDGENWTSNSNWGNKSQLSSWYGIKLQNGHISEINLDDNNLHGELPSYLKDLSELETLSLENNKLYGILPDIFDLHKLKKLNISKNMFIGEIPNSFNNLNALEIVNLNNNIFQCDNEIDRVPTLPVGFQTIINNIVDVNNKVIATQKLACSKSKDWLSSFYLFYKSFYFSREELNSFVDQLLTEPYKSDILYIMENLDLKIWEFANLLSKDNLPFYTFTQKGEVFPYLGVHFSGVILGEGTYTVYQGEIPCDTEDKCEYSNVGVEKMVEILNGIKAWDFSCDDDYGNNISNGSSRKYYKKAQSDNCEDTENFENRECKYGVLGGSHLYKYSSCSALKSCILPENTDLVLASGDSKKYYSSPESNNCSSISVNKTCTDGVLSDDDNFKYLECSSSTSCKFPDNQDISIANGESRIFYLFKESDNCGSVSQKRKCENGTLTGDDTYQNSSCSNLKSCKLPEDSTLSIAHGEVKKYYKKLVNSNCKSISEIRECNNGQLNGSYTFPTCTNITETGESSCKDIYNNVVNHNEVREFYSSAESGDCESIKGQRQCVNGDFLGNTSLIYPSCSNLKSCTGTDNIVIASGSSKIYYSANESTNCSAVTEVRVCTDGELSGSFNYPTCTNITETGESSCKDIYNNVVNHNEVREFYSSAESGDCESIKGQRQCVNGDFLGNTSLIYPSCSNLKSCTGTDNIVIASGSSKIYYSANESTNCSAVTEVRVCTDGELSGSFNYPTCTVISSTDTDTDGDGTKDHEDPDDDNDGVPDDKDEFPKDKTESKDTDGDGTGDNADDDDDNDGIPDDKDEFPKDKTESKDTDGDGTGDNTDDDIDDDGIPNEEDAFPKDKTESKDTDGDGTGDNTDNDIDDDGIPNEEDAFPKDKTETIDTDGDGTGDNADLDDDNDGVPDDKDAFPKDKTETIDTDGDGTGNNADTDDDNDGVSDLEEYSKGTDPLDPYSFPNKTSQNSLCKIWKEENNGDIHWRVEDYKYLKTDDSGVQLEVADSILKGEYKCSGDGENYTEGHLLELPDVTEGVLNLSEGFPVLNNISCTISLVTEHGTNSSCSFNQKLFNINTVSINGESKIYNIPVSVSGTKNIPIVYGGNTHEIYSETNGVGAVSKQTEIVLLTNKKSDESIEWLTPDSETGVLYDYNSGVNCGISPCIEEKVIFKAGKKLGTSSVILHNISTKENITFTIHVLDSAIEKIILEEPIGEVYKNESINLSAKINLFNGISRIPKDQEVQWEFSKDGGQTWHISNNEGIISSGTFIPKDLGLYTFRAKTKNIFAGFDEKSLKYKTEDLFSENRVNIEVKDLPSGMIMINNKELPFNIPVAVKGSVNNIKIYGGNSNTELSSAYTTLPTTVVSPTSTVLNTSIVTVSSSSTPSPTSTISPTTTTSPTSTVSSTTIVSPVVTSPPTTTTIPTTVSSPTITLLPTTTTIPTTIPSYVKSTSNQSVNNQVVLENEIVLIAKKFENHNISWSYVKSDSGTLKDFLTGKECTDENCNGDKVIFSSGNKTGISSILLTNNTTKASMTYTIHTLDSSVSSIDLSKNTDADVYYNHEEIKFDAKKIFSNGNESFDVTNLNFEFSYDGGITWETQSDKGSISSGIFLPTKEGIVLVRASIKENFVKQGDYTLEFDRENIIFSNIIPLKIEKSIINITEAHLLGNNMIARNTHESVMVGISSREQINQLQLLSVGLFSGVITKDTYDKNTNPAFIFKEYHNNVKVQEYLKQTGNNNVGIIEIPIFIPEYDKKRYMKDGFYTLILSLYRDDQVLSQYFLPVVLGESIISCDINDDGFNNMIDLILSLKFFNGSLYPSDLELKKVDKNTNGKIDLYDIIFIFKCIL